MTQTPLTARRAERRSIFARVAVLLLAASLIGVAGCGADSATRPDADPNPNPAPTTGMPPGVRTLVNIDRVNLPAIIYSGPASDTQGRSYNQVTIVVTRGSLEFVSATRFSMVFDLTLITDGVTRTKSWAVDGTYEMQGPTFKFHPANGVNGDFGGSRGNGVVTVHVDLVASGGANYYNFD